MAICLFGVPEANIKVNVVIFEITTKLCFPTHFIEDKNTRQKLSNGNVILGNVTDRTKCCTEWNIPVIGSLKQSNWKPGKLNDGSLIKLYDPDHLWFWYHSIRRDLQLREYSQHVFDLKLDRWFGGYDKWHYMMLTWPDRWWRLDCYETRKASHQHYEACRPRPSLWSF